MVPCHDAAAFRIAKCSVSSIIDWDQLESSVQPPGNAGRLLEAGDRTVADLPPELTEFLISKFTAIEQVDVFVLLFRSPERVWSSQEVAAALGVAPQSAGMRLYLLTSAGLLSASGGGAAVQYQYAPDPALDALGSAIADAHQADRSAVAAVVSPPAGSPARLFADAFRLKQP